MAPTSDPPTGPRICILGGGFGGLYTAVKLEGLMWPRGLRPRITLVDQGERFVFKPLLYELLSGTAGEDEVAPPFAQLLAPYHIAFRRARVAGVELEHPTPAGSAGGGYVRLADGGELPYDWLVLALGAETATLGVPGVRELACPFATYDDAVALRARLAALEEALPHPELVVVGGGYAGVELAAVLAERLAGRGRIKLVTSAPDILPGSPEGQREAARAALADKGVAVMVGARVTELRRAAAHYASSGGTGTSTGSSSDDKGTATATTAAELSKRLVYLRDREGQQEILEADLVLWSAGQEPVSSSSAAAQERGSEAAMAAGGGRPALPFPTAPSGATRTDGTLRVPGHERVFALGDIAIGSSAGSAPGSEGGVLPATAQVAFQQADYAAWNLWAAINGRPLLRFSYQHLGEMMSLGAASGALAVPIPVPPQLSAAVQAGPLGPLLRLAGVKLSGSYAGASDGVTLEGPLAAVLRRAAYLYRQPTDQQRLRVAASWARQAVEEGGRLAAALLRQGPLGSSGSSGR